jgi:hypothetical protein
LLFAPIGKAPRSRAHSSASGCRISWFVRLDTPAPAPAAPGKRGALADMDPEAGADGAGVDAAGAAAGFAANGSMRATAALGPAGAPMPPIAFAAIDGSELAACWAAPVEIGALLEDEVG